MKTLVLFYSRNGHTKTAAHSIAKELNADLGEILDKKNRKGIIGWIFAGRDGMRRNLTDISEPKQNPSDYDLVIIGTPIWAGNLVPAIRAYLTKNKSNIKNVAFFCTMGLPENKRAFEDMEKIYGKKPKATLALKEKEALTAEGYPKIEAFIKQLKM
ncbi:MAG: hypothetical protein NT099_09150 [Candidatus Saganbacteria bacterium]|nr:hypothetical protein [Candidatus Saganbacteria bacterium]